MESQSRDVLMVIAELRQKALNTPESFTVIQAGVLALIPRVKRFFEVIPLSDDIVPILTIYQQPITDTVKRLSSQSKSLDHLKEFAASCDELEKNIKDFVEALRQHYQSAPVEYLQSVEQSRQLLKTISQVMEESVQKPQEVPQATANIIMIFKDIISGWWNSNVLKSILPNQKVTFLSLMAKLVKEAQVFSTEELTTDSRIDFLRTLTTFAELIVDWYGGRYGVFLREEVQVIVQIRNALTGSLVDKAAGENKNRFRSRTVSVMDPLPAGKITGDVNMDQLQFYNVETLVKFQARCFACAVESYVGVEEDELSFDRGDLIAIIDEESAIWKGVIPKNGKHGKFPRRSVDIIFDSLKLYERAGITFTKAQKNQPNIDTTQSAKEESKELEIQPRPTTPSPPSSLQQPKSPPQQSDEEKQQETPSRQRPSIEIPSTKPVESPSGLLSPTTPSAFRVHFPQPVDSLSIKISVGISFAKYEDIQAVISGTSLTLDTLNPTSEEGKKKNDPFPVKLNLANCEINVASSPDNKIVEVLDA